MTQFSTKLHRAFALNMSIFFKEYYAHNHNFKKCNLTLAMSPTCHSNNTLLICWQEFFGWSQHQDQKKFQSQIIVHFQWIDSTSKASILTKNDMLTWQKFLECSSYFLHINVVYCGKISGSYLQYFWRYELFSPIFGPVQTDRRTDRKWCIWAHRAICTGGLNKLFALDHVPLQHYSCEHLVMTQGTGSGLRPKEVHEHCVG